MCRKDDRNLCQVDGKHLLKRLTEKIRMRIYVKLELYAKVRNLCHR